MVIKEALPRMRPPCTLRYLWTAWYATVSLPAGDYQGFMQDITEPEKAVSAHSNRPLLAPDLGSPCIRGDSWYHQLASWPETTSATRINAGLLSWLIRKSSAERQVHPAATVPQSRLKRSMTKEGRRRTIERGNVKRRTHFGPAVY